MALVGESGCGKSSTARAAMMLPAPTKGRVMLDGQDLTKLDARALRLRRQDFQMVFQDPVSSLNPRQKVRDIIAGPLKVMGGLSAQQRHERIANILETVGFDPNEAMERRPHQFSGGQCQRISIARALVVEPELLICDEPVSALDVSIQAQIINLLADLKKRLGLTMLFISHDLAVVKQLADRVAVMYLGKIVEIAEAQKLFDHPAHPYTRALLDAVPDPDPSKPLKHSTAFDTQASSALNPPSGCRFHPRCFKATNLCRLTEPVLAELKPGQSVACHFPEITSQEI
jgi:peptide/nickel transport system ATP-binding protein